MMPAYREIQPSPRLAPYVECYWHREDADDVPNHRVHPDGCADILYTSHCGEPRSLAAVGLMTRPAEFPVRAGTRFFGIRFRPGMAGCFLRDPAVLVDRMIALHRTAPRERGLFERFANALDLAQLIEAAESYLANPVYEPRQAVRLLAHSSTDEAMRASGISARHLRRLCLEATGVPPKYFTRILRFRRAVELLLLGRVRNHNWAHLAAEAGYFDQAHMIREFREFAGETPGRFIQSQAAGPG